MRNIECPKCRRKNKLPDNFSKASIACENCRATITISKQDSRAGGVFDHAGDHSQSLLEHHFDKMFRALGEYERHAPSMEVSR